MKRIKYILTFMGIITIGIFSCKDMDSTYEEFLVPNGITYPGRALEVKSFSGKHRVKLTWVKSADPIVVSATIFWNNYTESEDVDLLQYGDMVSYIVNGLDENLYSFMIRTYDHNGNVSIPVEILGTSYGDRYQAVLTNRKVAGSSINSASELVVRWEQADIVNGAYANEVQYVNTEDELVIYRDLIENDLSEVPGYKLGTGFQTRTLFLPDTTSIDTFYTDFIQHEAPSMKIDKYNWEATTDSFEPSQQMPSGPAYCAIDDDDDTFWHTQHAPTDQRPPYPHWLAIDMQHAATVKRIELTRRKENIDGIKDFTLQRSDDDENWIDVATYSLPFEDGPQSFDIPGNIVTRHLRLYMTEGSGPSIYFAHLAEFSAYFE